MRDCGIVFWILLCALICVRGGYSDAGIADELRRLSVLSEDLSSDKFEAFRMEIGSVADRWSDKSGYPRSANQVPSPVACKLAVNAFCSYYCQEQTTSVYYYTPAMQFGGWESPGISDWNHCNDSWTEAQGAERVQCSSLADFFCASRCASSGSWAGIFSWFDCDKFALGGDFRNYTGLTVVSDEGHWAVTKMELPDVGLEFLPESTPSMKFLPKLQVLDLGLSFDGLNSNLFALPLQAFSACSSLAEMYLGGLGIVEMAGLDEMTTLEVLDLRANRLNEVRGLLEKFQNLRRLDLRMNALRQVPLTYGHNLKELLLSYNRIESIHSNISLFTLLEELDLASNSISGPVPESLSLLTKLKSIDLSRNDITTIPENLFTNCPDLKVAGFSKNKISRVPDFPVSCGVTELSLDGNKIAELPWSLKFLNLNMSISAVNCSDAGCVQTELNFFNLSQNSFTEVPGVLSSMLSLQAIDLSHNFISDLGEGEILSCPNLLHLDLACNPLRELPVVSSTVMSLNVSSCNLKDLQSNLFSQYSNLFFLDLQRNEIEDIRNLQFGRDLWWLDVSYNNIQFLPDDSTYLEQLMFLGACDNRLESLPSWTCSLIWPGILDFGRNRLTSLPACLGNFGSGLSSSVAYWSRSRLYVNQNSLTELPDSLRNFTKFEVMDARGNQLTTVPAFKGDFMSCVYDFSENRITALPVFLFENAKVASFSVRENMLSEIPMPVLNKLGNQPDMSYLDLSCNRLTELDLSFSSCLGLFMLMLNDNLLTSVPDLSLCIPSLQVLSLARNKLQEIPTSLITDANALKGMKGQESSLLYLDLSGNLVKTLPSVISGVSSLQAVAPYFDTVFFINGQLRLLNLSDNPIDGSIYVDGVVSRFLVQGTNFSKIEIAAWGVTEVDASFIAELEEPVRFSMDRVALTDSGTLVSYFITGSGAGGSLDFFCDIHRTKRVFLESLRNIDISSCMSLSGSIPSCFSSMWLTSFLAINMNSSIFGGSPSGGRLSNQLSGESNSSGVADYSKNYYYMNYLNNAGLDSSILAYGSEFHGVGNQISCPSVTFADAVKTFCDLDPAYYGFAACYCDVDYYGNPAIGCNACLDPGICPVVGQHIPIPKPGYWADPQPPFHVSRCRPIRSGDFSTPCCNPVGEKMGYYKSLFPRTLEDADIVDVEKTISWCDEGYDGFLCSRCKSGYYAAGNACRACPRWPWLLGVLSFALVIMQFFGLVFIAFRQSSDWLSSKARKRQPIFGVSTLVLHFQMFNLMIQLGVSIFTTGLLAGDGGGMSFINFQLGSPECYIEGYDFFWKFIVAMVTPPLQLCGVLILFVWTVPCFMPGHFFSYIVKRGLSYLVGFIKGRTKGRVDEWFDVLPEAIASQRRASVATTRGALTTEFNTSDDEKATPVQQLIGQGAGSDGDRARTPTAVAGKEIGLLAWDHVKSVRFIVERFLYILLFVWFQSYMAITPRVFQGMRCQKYDHPYVGFSFLNAAPYIRCDLSGPSEYRTMVILSSFALTTWVLGLPTLFFFLILVESRVGEFLYRLYRIPEGGVVGQAGALVPFRSVDRRELVTKYWEVWKMFLRLLISLVVALFDFHSGYVPFFCILLFGTAAALQLFFWPYLVYYPSESSETNDSAGKKVEWRTPRWYFDFAAREIGGNGDRRRRTYANELEIMSFVLLIVDFSAAIVSKVPSMEGSNLIGVIVILLNILFFLFGIVILLRSPMFGKAFFYPVFVFRQLAALGVSAIGKKVFPAEPNEECDDSFSFESESSDVEMEELGASGDTLLPTGTTDNVVVFSPTQE